MAATDWDEETFEAHRPLLFSIAYRMLGSASEAEDVMQDAWLRALTNRATRRTSWVEGGIRGSSRCQGFSICLWQYSQSELIEVPSLATRLPSWQRKHPDDVVCPRLSG